MTEGANERNNNRVKPILSHVDHPSTGTTEEIIGTLMMRHTMSDKRILTDTYVEACSNMMFDKLKHLSL